MSHHVKAQIEAKKREPLCSNFALLMLSFKCCESGLSVEGLHEPKFYAGNIKEVDEYFG